MSRFTRISERLHRGELSIDFVGKRKLWYTISAIILLAALGGYFGRGLHMGIEFEGGAQYTINQSSISVDDARSAANKASGSSETIVQKAGSRVRVQVSGTTSAESQKIQHRMADDLGIKSKSIDVQVVGPSWGGEISQKAWQGLVIFLVLVVIYLAIAFEWRMAVAAFIALIHDLVITIGVYALVGFEVTPGTVIGLLTILGYSLYDTVVVFDTVRENTKGILKQNRRTYAEAANHGLNQTLVRSINTTVLALLPVAALLFVGGGILGAGMLNDIALALFIGLLAGAFSSICVATPFLVVMKEKQPEVRALAKRVAGRRAADAKKAAEAAARGPEDGDGAGPSGGGGEPGGPAGDGPRNAVPTTGGTTTRPGGAGSTGAGRRQPASRSRGRGRPSGKKR